MSRTKPLTAKQEAFVEYFAEPTSETFSNATQSMIKAGYSDNYAKHNSHHMLLNVGVKDAIQVYKGKAKAETVRTVQSLDAMYQAAYDIAEAQKNPTGMATNTTGIARLYGMDKDNQTNTEQVQELTEQQKAEAKRLANMRLSG